ncbi:MAG: hypothetical protein HOP17_08345, partial [Acidobacteria bacterium]|nr:hypothetical protein [Acidobacteriota bacterium]
MRRLKFFLLVSFAVVGIGLSGLGDGVSSQTAKPAKDDLSELSGAQNIAAVLATEAPAGFDNQTNGFVDAAGFATALETFAEREEFDDGLGPIYNAAGCAECHTNPVVGGISQITELRAGKFNGLVFTEHPGGSLIHSRASDASIQEQILDGYNVQTFRTSLNVLGDGFVEAVANDTLIALSQNQFFQSGGRISGQIVAVPVVEANGVLRVGRFGWKNQHASLLSFAGDAYVNEMGITNPLFPVENTSNGNPVDIFDPIPGIESLEDTDAFAVFMRATKAPPRGSVTAAAINGEQTFNAIGCAICHVSTMRTAPAGTVINGGALTVSSALGDKVFHPFGDFLMHDVGTGDGIVQNGGSSTRNKVRTAPLWGVRTRNRLMHDGESLTFTDAILRHQGESAFVTNRFNTLTT